ncbi:MAG: alpha-2-macroglobulin [Candidatus Tectimicrobiota bacterium]
MHCLRRLGLVVLLVLSTSALLSAAPPKKDAPKKQPPGQEQTPKEALKLLRVTPAGDDVPLGKQLVFEFDRPVVPLGRMERLPEEIPISITPPLACAWHWLNTTTLACELGERTTMARATRYTITVQPGIRTENGLTFAAPVTHTFLTQRPKVTNVTHQTWTTPGTPEWLLLFDQPVTSTTLARHVYVQVPPHRRVGVSVHEAPKQKGRGWLIRPLEELPLDTPAELWVEPGIVSTQGREPGAEQRAVWAFDTFPALRFLGLRCRTNAHEAVTIPAASKQPPQAKCNPQQVVLLFSAPVRPEGAREAMRLTPALRDPQEAWEEVSSVSRLNRTHKKGATYDLALPDLLWGATYRLQAPARQIKDEFGRLLAESIDVSFVTDHMPPELILRSEMAVLEQQVETHLPLEVLNLEAVQVQYDTLTTQGVQTDQALTIPLQTDIDTAYLIPLQVRSLLPAPSGAMQGTIAATPALEREAPQWFFAQVTPFHLHIKAGYSNTLVWVTAFDSGLPVPDVQVQLTREQLKPLTDTPTVLAAARTDSAGLAMLAGTSSLDPQLQLLNRWGEPDKPRLFVRLQHDNAMALVPLVHDFQVEAYGPNRSYIRESFERLYGHIHAWGTTPQGVYRAGDTVHYKLYVRDQDNHRLIPAPRTGYSLKVIDPTDKVVHTVSALTLSGFGAYHGEFPVPQNGAVGWYRFELSATFTPPDPAGDQPAQDETNEERGHTWEPMRVLVSDFTPAPFRVSTDLHGTALVTPEQPLTVTTQAKLHAGGPYSSAEVRLTASVEGRPLRSQDPQVTGFTFSTTAPKSPQEAATQAPEGEQESDTDEASEDDEGDFDAEAETGSSSETLHEVEERLDEHGTLSTTFDMPAAKVLYGQLRIESAVRDDRGKYVAGQATAHYAGRDRYVGLRQEEWVLRAGTPAQLKIVVVDEHGNAVAGTEVQVQIQRLLIKAAQMKGAGNAYVPHYVRSWEDVSTCRLTSAATPQDCLYTPPAPGTYKLTARLVDTQGRPHSTAMRRFATGAGEVLWETSPDHTLNILPAQKIYPVGATARYLVQNPFPGARALITVERVGVQQSWVETFPEPTAMVEFPITPDHLPGFYLSVVVMSPRVDKPLLNNQVDLGKPTFRMGYVRTMVQDTAKELRVTVHPQHEVYKPRQTATVDLQVHTTQGALPPVELAVAVLDEAVFDLISGGRAYFDPYQGFYQLDALDVRNFNILTQLIGRQKFDKKGANPGGDGGLDLNLRSVFKFVSYWNPSLHPDAEGKASISFPLPDNLTGWRVLAMAVSSHDLLGLGEGHFAVNKPTEIRPAMPNQVIAGDAFEASFTVLNRTETPRTMEVSLSASGPVQDGASMRQVLTAEPFKRYLMRLPIQTVAAGEIHVRVRAGDATDQDALDLPLTVSPPRNQAMQVAATYGTFSADTVSESIAFPSGMRTDIGHVSVEAAPTVLGGLDGVFTYIRDYPYICWEQKLTKGVIAAHYRHLLPYLGGNVPWPESQDLPERTLALAANYQAPNGGMTYYIPQDQYVSPDLSAYTALAFTWLRASGYAIPSPVEDKLHAYLQQFLRHDSVPDFYTRGMSATVRAMALAALATRGSLSRDDLLRYQPQVRDMSLFGKAQYLQALTQVADTEAVQAEVVSLIRNHANDSSGKVVFSESIDSAYQRLLDSPLRTNCAVLSALLASKNERPDATGSSAIAPKLVRTITQTRQSRTHWANTQENMFCLNAFVDYSRVYEHTEPHLTLRAFLGKTPLGEARFDTLHAAPVELRHSIQPEDVGRKTTITLAHEGEGRVYYAARLFYAPTELQNAPVHAGLEVQREYSVERGSGWVLLDSPMQIKLGELVRVDLYISAPAARNFVVVDDPVPGGLEPVNRDLATASKVDADKARVPHPAGSWWFRHSDWRPFGASRWSFYHKELRHHAVRFYSEYLPAGRYHLAYVAQAIAPGEFTVLPLRAEEMYHPETYGQSPPATLRVLLEGQKAAQQ